MCKEARKSFAEWFDELIERIPLYDILLMPGIKQNYDSWIFLNGVLRK